MKELIFIRHAETDMADTFCGHSDPPLNERGLGQLPLLIEKLRKKKIDEIYSSDLRRARQTADAIAAAFNLRARTHVGLRELNFGQWEGLTWRQIEERDPVFARRWVDEYPNLHAPWGETMRHFKKRVLHEVTHLSQISKGKHVAVVTHAGVIRTVLTTLHQYSEETAWRRTKSYGSIVLHKVRTIPASQPLRSIKPRHLKPTA